LTISRVQGNASNAHAWPVDSLGVTLTSTPSIGNVLIAVIGSYNSYAPDVSSISQSGVSWARQVQSKSSSLYGRNVEIWAGVVSGSAPTSLTINFVNTGDVFADICEYTGLATSNFLDQTATASGVYATALATGTTGTTSNADELWVGGIFSVCDAGNGDSDTSPTNGFTLLDGVGNVYGQTKTLAYLEKIVSSTGNASSGVTGGSYNTYEAYVGCIATFKASSGTVVVPSNGRYSGDGSKQDTISYSGSNVIMQIDSNSSDLNSNAIIENLIIDGQNQSNTIGVQLQNVANCIIRNLTIMNCETGIHLWITGSNSMRGNRFEHIRMKNVKYGIVFDGNTTDKDFSYTTIDDVQISMWKSYYPDATGILVGTDATNTANLDNAFVKATVWLDNSEGKAMEVKGRVKYGLVNLEVEQNFLDKNANPPTLRNGKGLQVDSGAYVTDNQSFYLATGGIKGPNPEYRLYGNGTTADITNISI
jgi:parallel beta-helix repeat protein